MENVLLIFYGVTIIIYIINDLRINKEKDKLIDEIMNFSKELVQEKTNILEIIRNAEETKEQFYFTLEKIKKELLH